MAMIQDSLVFIEEERQILEQTMQDIHRRDRPNDHGLRPGYSPLAASHQIHQTEKWKKFKAYATATP